MRALRDDADAAAKEAFKRAAIETDRASFLELALQQERRERERLKETLEHAHRQKTSELERDHARDRARFAAAETTLRNEIDARSLDADEIRARFESQSAIFFGTRTEEQRLRTELELLTLAYDRLAETKRTTTDRLTSRVDALRDALGASRAEANDLTRLLSGSSEKTNPLYFEDAFLARDRAEADATAVRGQLAEAVTEQRRWRARCDAAERRAVEAERRAEKDAMRAVVADARAASFRETMRVNPGKSDESSLTNEEGVGRGIRVAAYAAGTAAGTATRTTDERRFTRRASGSGGDPRAGRRRDSRPGGAAVPAGAGVPRPRDACFG
jgi:hypothetical protein